MGAVQDDLRIELLRRRVEGDPGSIAFAQLGEEYRRAGRPWEAIATCRAGLARHPTYLSARVTLGRSLIAAGELDEAERELQQVLRVAGENLAALKGLAEVSRRRGHLAAALARYRAALDVVHHDPEIEQALVDLDDEIRQAPPPVPAHDAVPAPGGGVPAAVPSTPKLAGPTRVLPAEAQLLPVLERWLDAIVADRQRRALSRARHG